MRIVRLFSFPLTLVGALSISLLVVGCSKQTIVKDVAVGTRFPSVTGQSLQKSRVKIPEDFAGSTTILLIGYQQKTQFDIDRWILGFLQLGTPAKLVELPTIAGMMPQMVQSFIDDGMRSGIPKEDWASVVTVFEDADKIISAVGNERPQSAHVVVLDRSGNIRLFQNEGYSASRVSAVDRVAREIGQ